MNANFVHREQVRGGGCLGYFTYKNKVTHHSNFFDGDANGYFSVVKI